MLLVLALLLLAVAPSALAVGVTTTVPDGTQSWPQGTTQDLGWTLSEPVDVGQFGVWLIDSESGSWYSAGYYDAVPGRTTYTPSFSTLGIPLGTYSAVVYYRSDPAVWLWEASGTSPGTAEIAPGAFQLTTTVPDGTQSWPEGTTQDLGWTLSAPVDVGQFGVWLIDSDSGAWYSAGYYDAVAGRTLYAPSFSTLGIPLGTYSAVVFYRSDPNVWFWEASDASPGTAEITAGAFQLTTTVPDGTQSWPEGTTQDLGWTLSAAVDVGQFGVWLIDSESGSWYSAGYYDAVPGRTLYTPSFSTLGLPLGTYSAVVYYRSDPAVWLWQASDASPGTAEIAPGAFQLTTTVPDGTQSWPQGTTQDLGWTLSAPVDVGQFGVWLIDSESGAWYSAGYYDAVPGETLYTPSFSTLGIPLGTYSAVVFYRSDPNVWLWQASDASPGTAEVTAGATSITVTVPDGTQSWPEDTTQHLGWTLSAPVDVGQFGVWLIDQATGSWYSAGYYDAVPGRTLYTPSFSTLGLPLGTYKAVVYYRSDPNVWLWQTSDESPGTAEVIALGTLAVTHPSGGQDIPYGQLTDVTWTLDPAGSIGSFDVSAVGPTGTVKLNDTAIAVVAGQTDYSYGWLVTQQLGAGYTIRVTYNDAAGRPLTSVDSDAFAIVAPVPVVPTVAAPNGGESVGLGTQRPITWTVNHAVGVGSFDVVVWRQATGTPVNLGSVAADPTKTDYSFTWTVTQARATDWKARVVYRDAAGVFVNQDNSNDPFSIVTPQLDPVTAPSTGGELVLGATSDVTWTLPEALAVGSFDLVAKSGALEYPLNGSPIAAQAGKTDYSLAWTVKEPLGADYTLRLIYRDAATPPQEVTHADSGVFAIVAPQLTLTSPLEGASLTFGAQTDVIWTVDHALSAGSFDLVAESGLAVNAAPIAVDPAKTSYSFAWAPTLALGGGHTLHLVYKDAAGQERASSTPPVSFSVVAPTVTVTAPLAGARLDFGVATSVTWTVDHALSAGTFDLVASSQTLGLEYPLNAEPIAADPGTTTYSYSWTVAQLPAADYQIKVIYFDEGAQEIAFGESELFTILEPQVTVLAPVGGDQVTFNNETTVTWTIDHAVATGLFELQAISPTQGTETISSVTADPAKTQYDFTWTVTQLPATDYTLRVIYRDPYLEAREVARGDSGTFSIVTSEMTVTAPSVGEKIGSGTTRDVTWTVEPAVSVGSFEVWAVSQSRGDHQLNTAPIAADGAKTEYTFAWTVAQPPAADYQIKVVYLDTEGQSANNGVSDLFTIDPAHATDLVAAGKYEYVADGLSGLKIIDISNPDSPVQVGAVDTPGNAQGVTVMGDYAYVADGDPGMHVVDITDPTHPVIKTTLDMPLNQPAKDLALSAGWVLQDFESTDGWTVSNGTMASDAEHKKHGSASLKVTSVGGATDPNTAQLSMTDLNNGAGWDLSRENRGIQMWVYLHSTGISPDTPSLNMSLKLYLSNDNSLTNSFVTHNSISCHEGWNLLHWSPASDADPDWTVSGGSPSWNLPIKRMSIDVRAPAGRTYEASFDDFRVGVTGIKTAFLWTFDDGYEEDYADVFPYLQAHGQKASMFVIGSWPGTQPPGGTKITLEHLTELYNAGWAVGNHTYGHVDLAGLTQHDAALEIQAGRDWLHNNGFTRTENYLAFPYNDTSQSAVAAAIESGVIAARQQGNRNEYMPLDEALLLSAFADGENESMVVSEWTGRIDRAIANGGTLVINAHRMYYKDINGQVVVDNRAAFQSIVDYLAAKHVWAPAIDEWYNTMAAQGETIRPWAGHYLYVASGTAGVQVVDIADPLNPVIVGAAATTDSATDVAADDTLVAVADSTGGLTLLDASAPAAPTGLGGSITIGDAKGVAMRGGYAFLAEGSEGLRIVNMADPLNPPPVAVDTPGDAHGVALVGHYAYVADGNATIQVVDITNLANPQLVGTMPIFGQAEGIEVWGGRAYVAAGSAGLQVVPLATP